MCDFGGSTGPAIKCKSTLLAICCLFIRPPGRCSIAARCLWPLPYSNFVFVGVYPDQTLASWIGGHVEALAAFQGVPRIIVPDNPKPLVTDTRGDLVLNDTYQA